MSNPDSVSSSRNPRNLENRWTTALIKPGWTPVARGFLNHYSDLGISSAEAMFIIHLVSYKWSRRMPFPSLVDVADKMGVTDTSVRKYARDLEKRGLLKRYERPGSTSQFDLSPLFAKLEVQMRKKSIEAMESE